MPNKKVLIIEDDAEWIHFFKTQFNEDPRFKDVMMLQASSLAQARHLFLENPDVAIITVDGILEGTEIKDSAKFVEYIRYRTDYRGPLVAGSSGEDFNEILVLAGCTHFYHKTKLLNGIAGLLEEQENKDPGS